MKRTCTSDPPVKSTPYRSQEPSVAMLKTIATRPIAMRAPEKTYAFLRCSMKW